MTPPPYKANQIFALKMAGSWGKFSVSEGGLEGESPVFQEGALSLQGLPHPSKVFPSPSECNIQKHHDGETRNNAHRGEIGVGILAAVALGD